MVKSHEISSDYVLNYLSLSVVRDGKEMTDAEKAERDLLEEWRLLHEEVETAPARMADEAEQDRQAIIDREGKASMKEVEFVVYGRPKGKGRPRFTLDGHAYTPQATKAYEKEIRQAFREAGGTSFGSVPVAVEVVAYYPIPKSAKKSDKEAMAAGMVVPMVKPDIDNVLKAVLDGIQGDDGAFHDDVQVTSVRAEKRYDRIGAPGAVVVRIRDVSP